MGAWAWDACFGDGLSQAQLGVGQPAGRDADDDVERGLAQLGNRGVEVPCSLSEAGVPQRPEIVGGHLFRTHVASLARPSGIL